MIEILGRTFISDKEAAARYGYSQRWFIEGRQQKYGPKYVQLKDGGKVLYPLDETDKWFKERMELKE